MWNPVEGEVSALTIGGRPPASPGKRRGQGLPGEGLQGVGGGGEWLLHCEVTHES